MGPEKAGVVELLILIPRATFSWISGYHDLRRITGRPSEVDVGTAILVRVGNVVGCARARRQHARQLPVVRHERNRFRGRAGSRHVRQIPHEIRLDEMPPVPHVVVQFLVLGLVVTNRIGAVGRVLQPDLRNGFILKARRAGRRQPENVIETKRDPTAESAVQAHLN